MTRYWFSLGDILNQRKWPNKRSEKKKLGRAAIQAMRLGIDLGFGAWDFGIPSIAVSCHASRITRHDGSPHFRPIFVIPFQL